MDSKELQDKIDKRYCGIVRQLITSNSTTREKIHESAGALLAIEPMSSIDDAITKMEFFIAKFPEYKDMLPFVQAIKDDTNVGHIIDKMHKHLRDNNIDEALKVAFEK